MGAVTSVGAMGGGGGQGAVGGPVQRSAGHMGLSFRQKFSPRGQRHKHSI